MSLRAGALLGHYEIRELIGKGGMGEVYRAKDGKLGRDVAIKILPEELAEDGERLRRFQREAKVLASLNHPNIASIYGLEQQEATHYLVLELVEGETLAERIARGPLPFEEALAIATKIADALEEAHDRGIIHRDLKPPNIKLTPREEVKVLDFGLAKALVADAPEADTSMSPTLTRDATRIGVILGTAAYMSPEQAKGKDVDERADIWAFGAVVYEMLTGKRAFEGEDVSDTLAAVLRAEVDFGALPESATPAVRTALSRCLRKSPKERFRDIGDVQLAMEGAFESGTSSDSSRHSPWHRSLGLGALMALLSGLAVWGLTRSPEPAKPVVSFVLTAPPNPSILNSIDQDDLAISPDGSRVVYRPNSLGALGSLYQRSMERLEATELEGTQNGVSPCFSPDGAWVAFTRGNELMKTPLAGGIPVRIATLPSSFRGMSWGADGTIVFGELSKNALYRVSAAGGEPEILLEPDDPGETAFRWPQILPGGRAVLFTIFRVASGSEIAVLDLASSKVIPLLSPGTHPRYTSTGHVIYGDVEGALYAVPFDLNRLEVHGDPVVLVEGVVTKPGGSSNFALAENGTLAYVTGSGQSNTRLVWVDRTGREELIETEPMRFDMPRLSPDGRRIAVVVTEAGNTDLHVVELERGTMVRLTRTREVETSPLWTGDGGSLVFGSSDGDVHEIASDGAGEVTRLAEGIEGPFPQASATDGLPLPLASSPDEQRIVFYKAFGPTSGDIFTLAVGESRVEPLLAAPDLMEAHPSLSPDGRFLAYTGNESGRMEIYVRPFPNVNDARYLISPAGGNEPVWSRDGRELFYWDDATSSMMTVPVTTEPEFRAGVATRLFGGNYLFPQAGRHYDVSADGQRFLMVKPGTGSEAQKMPDGQIVVIQNWFSELERRAPRTGR